MTSNDRTDVISAAWLDESKTDTATPANSRPNVATVATAKRHSWRLAGAGWLSRRSISASCADSFSIWRCVSAWACRKGARAFCGRGLVVCMAWDVSGLSMAFCGVSGSGVGNVSGMTSGSLPGADSSASNAERVRVVSACSLVERAEIVRTSARDSLRALPGMG